MHWAVILAGGSGSRFWPLSSPTRPKQLLPLLASGSTAEETMARLEGLIPPERTLVVTGSELAPLLQERLGIPAENILVELRAASTGPALVWASHEALRRDPNADVLSLHADWHVGDPEAFRNSARQALGAARAEGRLVTVGIVPTRVETGYGYIIPGAALGSGTHRVERFTEKPGFDLASELLAQGALWNSGLFAWSARVLLDQILRFTPEIAAALPHLDSGNASAYFESVTAISIDVGLLERSDAVVVLPGRFSWDDIGTWEALARIRSMDGVGNVKTGRVAAVGTERCIIWSDGTPIVASGVHDLVIVAANGRVLVLDRADASRLKETLDQLPPDIRELPQ
ncbi:MAG: sugar phosphate nucleotidyltransferase [Gemmatimonadota bacterium]|nr:sugar phosphate nucleotidyltransferase [Gemmatimonadota bacterium]